MDPNRKQPFSMDIGTGTGIIAFDVSTMPNKLTHWKLRRSLRTIVTILKTPHGATVYSVSMPD
jgi:hypothetical protein